MKFIKKQSFILFILPIIILAYFALEMTYYLPEDANIDSSNVVLNTEFQSYDTEEEFLDSLTKKGPKIDLSPSNFGKESLF